MNRCFIGDCRDSMRDLIAQGVRVQTCVTSPPYWGLRDYGTAQWEGGDSDCEHEGSDRYYTEKTAAVSSADAFCVAGEANAEGLRKGRWREGGQCIKCGAQHRDRQLGLESTPDEYVQNMVEVFRLVRDLLADDGTLWLNLGDSYARAPGKGQHKPGDSGKQNYIIERGGGRAASCGIPDGLKEKDLVGIPWRVAFALQADGWYLRQDIIWHKPNPMPESVRDRCTKSHEYIFLLSKRERYYFDAEAIAEPSTEFMLEQMRDGYDGNGTKDYDAAGAQNPSDVKRRIIENKKRKFGGANKHDGYGTRIHSGNEWEPSDTPTRNKRSVWTVTTKGYPDAHFATFPPDLIEPCILAGSKPGDVVLDPFFGSGTTGEVAQRLGRQWIGCELNPDYAPLQAARTAQLGMPL